MTSEAYLFTVLPPKVLGEASSGGLWSRLPIPPALAPPPREGHAAAVLGGRLYVFSGRGHPDVTRDGGPYLQDMWVLEGGQHWGARRVSTHVGSVVAPAGSSSTGVGARDLSCGLAAGGAAIAPLPPACGIPETPSALPSVLPLLLASDSGHTGDGAAHATSTTTAASTATATATATATTAAVVVADVAGVEKWSSL